MRLDSAKLREGRQRRLLTQAELAKRAGTTEATVNRLENGMQTARISTIRKLAEALEVPAEDLITWEVEKQGKAAA